MCDFKDAKVGDRVWHAMWGWGTIDDIRHGNKKPIFVQFPTHREEFRTDGTFYSSDIYPSLFWDEVKIVPPPKPRRKVKKVVEGWIYLRDRGAGWLLRPHDYFSYKKPPEGAPIPCGESEINDKFIGPIFIRHEYYVEE